MWRKIIAGLALFAVLIGAADAANHRGGRRLLLLENTSAAVSPPNPAAADLNFATGTYTGGSLASMLTNTNSTGGYCADSGGLLHLIAANTPRVCSGTGLLVEELRINLAINSQDFTNASWSKFTSNGGTISITAAAGTAPDGTNTAQLFSLNRSLTNGEARANATFTGTASGYSGSVYLKAATAGDVGKQINITFYNGSSVIGVVNVTLTSSWQRVTTVQPLAASASCQFIIGYLAASFGGNSQTGATGVLVWGGQAELGATPTSYIPTTSTAVTRSADNITVSGVLASTLAASAASLVATTTLSNQSVAATIMDANGTVLLGKNVANASNTAVGAALQSINTGTWTGSNILGLAWNASGGTIQLNGGPVRADTTARTPATTLHVGSVSGTSAFWNGYISRLTAYASKIPFTAALNYVAEGDSITIGLGGTPAYPYAAVSQMPGGVPGTPGTNTPTSSPVTGVGTVFITDIGQSGISTITLDQTYSTRAGATFSVAGINALTYMAGTNTSGATDTNYGQKYWWVRDYLRQARNTGYQRIVIGTTIARDDDGGSAWTGTLVPLNTQIRTNYNGDLRADGLADFGASSLFSPASAADNLTYYISDKIHPNATGEAAMGTILEPVLLAAFQGAGVQTFAATTWSPFANSTNGFGGFDGTVALSTDFRTATVPSGFGNYGIRGFPGSQTGLFYWENSITLSNTVVVGIVDDYFPFNNATFLGGDVANHSIGYSNNGNIAIGGAVVATASAFVTGDVTGTAANFTTKNAWFRKCTLTVCSSWNGNGSANPATGVGGISFSALQINGAGDRFYPAGGVRTLLDAVASDFATSQLTQSIPSGYSIFGP